MAVSNVVTVPRLSAFKGHVTRAFKTCEEELSAVAPSTVNLEFKCESLINSFTKYQESFLLFEEQQDAAGDSYDTANKSYQATEKSYYDVRSRVQSKIQSLKNQQPAGPPSSPANPPKPKIKLKPVELPVFSGNRRDWPPFWESFHALVHQNDDYDNIVKFTYLKQSLKGEAAKHIRGFSGVGTDYQKALDFLNKLYADKRAIRYDIIDKLVSLKAPKCNKDDLLEFHAQYTTLLRQLEDYVTDIHSGDWAVEVMIQRKLPSNFCKYLYDRYHENFFTETQISDGILEFAQRFENSCSIDSVTDCYQSTGKMHKPIAVPPVAVQNVTVDKQCIFCSSPHSSRHCPQFPTVAARKSRLESLKRCARCCATNHFASECRINAFNPCITCSKTNHHGFLCFQLQSQSSNVNANLSSAKPIKSSDSVVPTGTSSSKKKSSSTKEVKSSKQDSPKPAAAQPEEAENSANMSSIATSQHFNTSDNQQPVSSSTALPTALVTVKGTNHSSPCQVRCFFDQGSQLTFVTQSLQQQLKLKPVNKISIDIRHGFNNVTPARELDVIRLIASLGKRRERISAVVVPALPNSIQTPGLIEAANDLRCKDIKLADQYDSDTVTDIDIMIGGDFYSKFINGLTNRCGINLLKTSAGYVIYGPVSSNIPVETRDVQLQHISVADFTVFTEEPPLHKLWDLDTIGINATAPTPQDDVAYRNFLDTVEYTDRYYTKLPWKKDHPPLPNNYKMAVGQLHALHKSLCAKPEMLNHYHSIIQDQLDQGFIEKVTNPKVHSATHYIPHHAVAKESPTTPLRIVYNCSAKASKEAPSLNDCLMKGPALTEKLGDILVTFRTNKYAFSADISKAFLRIGLQEVDRDFTRFLWMEDPHNPNSNIVTYRFASVLFGATSSPFLLQATLDFHLRKSTSPYKALIRDHFYVDNLVGALNSEDELLEYYVDANRELSSANMPLREWSSNAEKLRCRIREDQNGAQTESVNLLGLVWNTNEDTIQLHPVQLDTSDVQLTKRKLLSNVSKVFDPLGLFSPITVRGKILLQQAWKLRIGWDDILPSEFVTNWKILALDLNRLSSISIPRCTSHKDSSVHLIVFCDASITAFGVVAYTMSDHGAHLLTSRTRVAPLKSRTLPQLELTALQLGAQLAHTLCSILKHITFSKITIFSDNEAALQWVRNDHCTIPYVKNRVHKIRELTPNMQILHVPSEDNPADLLTRGVSFEKFCTKKLNLWFKRPSWLLDEAQWPTQKQFVVVQELRTDVKNPPEPTQVKEPLVDPDRFSTFDALVETTQFVFKFLRLTYSPEDYWIKYVQRLEYPNVYQYLSNASTDQNSLRVSSLQTPIKKFVKDLGLYLDSDSGIIRSHSRLHHSLYHSKDQILLPPNSRITALIILKVHRSINHGGMSETLTQLRLQFWIPKGRLAVKQVLKTCAHCRRILAAKIANPGPPPLPPERVQFVRPFDAVGIDYTGAILIRDSTTNELVKVYICLFTCTSSRAVHLELARDMSAATFISLFRRFCARFSTPRLVISDNGTSFTATAKFLKSLFEDPTVKQYFRYQKITWKFIPPRAPWQGGFYERMVGIVKGCLQKSLFKRFLSWDELVTVLLEVEQCVNNRPLTYVASELPDLLPLTPNHLLKGEITRIMPPISTEDKLDPQYLDYDALKLNLHYSKLSETIQKFVQVWAKDYLTALKEKHFGNVPPQQAVSIRPGDIVLLSNDHPRNRWPLGRITKVFPDSDHIVRTVEVLSQGHTSIRTLDKLYALELSAEPEVQDLPDVRDSPSSDTEDVPDVRLVRPKRVAAQRAQANRRVLIDADQL